MSTIPLLDPENLPLYFSPDYRSCQDHFIKAAFEAGARVERLMLEEASDLSIDFAFIGSKKPERLIIHASGTGGVDGFAGSAVQLYLLSHLPRIPAGTAILFIHAVNPWGMAHSRRVNENGVDLNHNFAYYKNDAMPNPEAARQLEALLVPTEPPSWTSFCKLGMNALLHYIRHGSLNVEQTQTLYPNGLFYGGAHLEQGASDLMSLLEDYIKGVETLCLIDFQTGAPHVYCDDSILIQEDYKAQLKGEFRGRIAPHANDPGSFASAVARLVDSTVHKYIFTQKVATHTPLFSDAALLNALIQENQEYHFGDRSRARERCYRTFVPDSEEWRENAIRLGHDAFFRGFRALHWVPVSFA